MANNELNRSLQSLFITHQSYIERYKNAEIKKLLTVLKQAETEIKKILYASGSISSLNKKRYEALLKEIRDLQTVYIKDFSEKLQKDLLDLAEYEYKFYADSTFGSLNELKVKLNPVMVTPEKLNSVIVKTPIIFDNTSYTIPEFLKEFSDSAIGGINQIIRTGYLTSKTVPQIVSELYGTRGRYLRSLNDAKTVTRTMVMHYANTARTAFYKNNLDVIRGYQWVSTLDSRTCFTAGNMVSTVEGVKDIAHLGVGDKIHNGFGEVVEIIETQQKLVNELVVLELDNGKLVECTPEHQLLTKNRGWVEAQFLYSDDELMEGFLID